MAKLISSDRGSRSSGGSFDPAWQRFFLLRLKHLVELRHAPLPEASEENLRLLDKAVYSTFCDCLDLAVGIEARAILRNRDALRHEEVAAGPHEPSEVDPN